MSIAHAATQAKDLSTEFVNEVRSTCTLVLEFFVHHQSILLTKSSNEEKIALELDVYDQSVSNYLLIYQMRLSVV
jgi:hypothetical protein